MLAALLAGLLATGSAGVGTAVLGVLGTLAGLL